MISKFALWLFTLHGWKLENEYIPKEVHKCILVYAPHTSNWDFYFGVLGMTGWKIPVKFAIKEFWVKSPVGFLIKLLGGVGVRRRNKSESNIDCQITRLAEVFKENEKIALIITPEGTRSKTTQWKTGFYRVAKEANVPIATLCADFDKRKVKFGPVYCPDEDLDKIMKSMMQLFSEGSGKNKNKFALDSRYL